MIGLLRYILAGCLVLALIAGGVPHIRVAAAGPMHGAVHVHAHADAHISVAQHDAMPGMQMHSESGMPADNSADSCKDMKCCTMCAAATVEPMTRISAPVRVALAVHYEVASTSLTEVPTGLDPGIPIAA